MKIGSQASKLTAISASNPDTIVVRGYDLCADLIGKVTFTDHAWLLVAGKLPSPEQRHVLDAALVAIAEHGLVPSVAAARMTLAAAPEAIQGAVAAGILGCGSVILGSAESAARFIAGILGDVTHRARRAPRHSPHSSKRATRAAPFLGSAIRCTARRIPAWRVCWQSRPRTGLAGRHVAVARLIEQKLPEVTGKPLVMNVSGAIAAVLLDAGYPLLAVKGVPILARTASLVAHLLEEQERPIGFILADGGSSSVGYDGASPAGFVPSA